MQCFNCIKSLLFFILFFGAMFFAAAERPRIARQVGDELAGHFSINCALVRARNGPLFLVDLPPISTGFNMNFYALLYGFDCFDLVRHCSWEFASKKGASFARSLAPLPLLHGRMKQTAGDVQS